MASDHRARAKEDEATHSPRSWETKGSRKLLAPLKRTSVMLSSVRVSREKGITRAIQVNMVVWRGGGNAGNRRGGVQDTHQHNMGTSLLYRCATIYHVTPLIGPHMCMEKWVQMARSQKFDFNLLIFARLIY